VRKRKRGRLRKVNMVDEREEETERESGMRKHERK